MTKKLESLEEPLFLPTTKVEENEEADQLKKNKRKNVSRRNLLLSILLIIFSPVNLVAVPLLVILLMHQQYYSLLLLLVVIPLMILGLFYEVRAYRYNKKNYAFGNYLFHVLINNKLTVLKDDEVSQRDLVYINNKSHLSFDAIVKEGEVIVDESRVNGGSILLSKKANDRISAGSRIVSGNAYVIADKVGHEISEQQVSNKSQTTPCKYSNSCKFIGFLAWFFVLLSLNLLILNLVNYKDSLDQDIVQIIETIAFIFPLGLFFFYALLKFVNAKRLKNVAVIQDISSISSFADIDVYCFDKTNTLSCGNFSMRKIAPVTNIDQDGVTQLISNILIATKDESEIAHNLRPNAIYQLSKGVVDVIPYSTQNKFIGAAFTGGKTYILGEPDHMSLVDKGGIIRRRNTFLKQGYRVYVLAETRTTSKIQEYSVISFILLLEEPRESAIKAITELREKGKNIKIISGDNEFVTQELALKFGNEKIISLKDQDNDFVEKVASIYDVFVDCAPEQKQVLIRGLQNKGLKVAMIGDGDNDALALKQANASLAMEDGTALAKASSQFVLKDNNFDNLGALIEEGNRHENALLRIVSFYITKGFVFTVLALAYVFISLASGIKEIRYPFTYINLMAYEALCLILPSLISVFSKNSGEIKGNFASRLFKSSFASLMLIMVSTYLPLILFALQVNGVFYTTFSYDSFLTPYQSSTAMGVTIILVSTLPYILFMYLMHYPFKKDNVIKLIIYLCLFILVGSLDYFMYSLNGKDVLGIRFELFSGPQIYTLSLIFIVSICLYLIISHTQVMHKDYKNQKVEDDNNDQD